MRKKLVALAVSVAMVFGSVYTEGMLQNTTAEVVAADTNSGQIASSGAANATVTAPAVPKVTQIKGGNKRVKLYWEPVDGASGYYIYYTTDINSGTFTRIKTITDASIGKYVKKSLTQNLTYYFKISAYVDTVDGKRMEGDSSVVYGAKTSAVEATSKGAKKYSTLNKFKKSPAYKKYPFLQKANYTKSFAIPGQKQTNVAGFSNQRMFPQGGCVAGSYMLVSAYAYNGEDESVIYVMSRASKSYITTLVMPNKTKINAMAYDGTNVWVTQGKKIAYFSYDTIIKAVTDGASYRELIAFDGTFDLASTNSVMAYRDGVLWIGAYNAKSVTKMYGYVVGKDVLNRPTITRTYYMTIPNRTKAVAFDEDGYMYITRSSQSNNKQSGYISQIRVYKPNFSTPKANGSVKKNPYSKKITFPPRASGSMVYGAYIYTVFSGARYSKCNYKVDRVIAYKRAKLH